MRNSRRIIQRRLPDGPFYSQQRFRRPPQRRASRQRECPCRIRIYIPRDRSTEALRLALRKQLARLQSLDVPFNALEEKADQARSNFELFAQKRDQAQIEDAMDERKLVNIAVAETPTSAFSPTSPKPRLNAALGLLTALFLAAGAVYLAESSRTTIASARELESFSRYPVLATAPQDIRVARKPWSGFKKQRASRSERDTASPRNMIPAIQKLGGIHET